MRILFNVFKLAADFYGTSDIESNFKWVILPERGLVFAWVGGVFVLQVARLGHLNPSCAEMRDLDSRIVHLERPRVHDTLHVRDQVAVCHGTLEQACVPFPALFRWWKCKLIHCNERLNFHRRFTVILYHNSLVVWDFFSSALLFTLFVFFFKNASKGCQRNYICQSLVNTLNISNVSINVNNKRSKQTPLW